jgi:PAS domain S-box-containing protein
VAYVEQTVLVKKYTQPDMNGGEMPKATLLIVDDEALVQESLTSMLQHRGYTAHSAGTAEEALAMVDETPIDIALLDVNLPDLDGLTLYKRLKSGHPRISCILITGTPSLESAITAVDSGVDGYLIKPILALNLYMRIEEILKQKELEKELQRSNESLMEAQRVAKLGIRDWDLSTGNITWSGEARRIFGQASEDGPLTYEAALSRIHPDDREPFRTYAEQAVRTGGGSGIEYRLQCPDGAVRIIHEQSKILRDDDKHPVRMLGIFRDVTEEKKLKKESEYRLQQVIHADKLSSLGEVVAGVAHEINNPNSFISYNAPLLEETWQMLLPIIDEYAVANPGWRSGHMGIEELRQDMMEIIKAIKTGSDRIKKVVLNLKDFARMDDGREMKPVQVNQVVENTLTIVGARVRKSVRNLDVKLAEGLPMIHGYFQKLEQVTANLVLNAAHATSDSDDGRIVIRTRHVEGLGCVVIEVEDNGRGMPIDVVGRVFDPFFTTRRDSGGTGLGLSVSYGLVKEHGGNIGVLSREGIGSRFTVYLPVEKDLKRELRPAILCVDDDPQVLRMLQTFFVSVKNMSLETLESSENVLGYLARHPEVDIVLSDIWMPNLSGWELYQQIKAEFPLVSVVLYSGDEEALSKKPSDVPEPEYLMRKPLEFSKLMTTIEGIGRQRL